MTAEVEEEVADYGGEFHCWTCPNCGEVNEEESDPHGEKVECDCGWKGLGPTAVAFADHVRSTVMKGRVFTDDSAELLNEARNEWTEDL